MAPVDQRHGRGVKKPRKMNHYKSGRKGPGRRLSEGFPKRKGRMLRAGHFHARRIEMGRADLIWYVLLCQFWEACLLTGKETEWRREKGLRFVELDVPKQ